MSSNENLDSFTSPRLCHVIKSAKFDGYGFNLHAEKSKPGQYIGKVDDGSPAEAAGLKEGDRILEVNGVSIANETHKQVVNRIRALQNETKLLIVRPKSAETNGNGTTEKLQNNNGNSMNGNARKNDEMDDNKVTLKLNMTAAELRAQLASKKKYDAKKEAIDFKKKYNIVETL